MKPVSRRAYRERMFPTLIYLQALAVCVSLATGMAQAASDAVPAVQTPRPARIEYFGDDGKFHWREQPTVVEIEALLPQLKASAGTPVRQEMAGFGPGWGGSAQVFWRPPPPVDTPIRNWPNLRLAIPVPRPGRYRVTLVHTVAPDYARVRIFLKGQAVTDMEGYAREVAARRVELGEYQLDGTSFELLFTVYGRNTRSDGFGVGLDRVELRAVPTTGSTSRTPPDRAGSGAGTAGTAGKAVPDHGTGQSSAQAGLLNFEGEDLVGTGKLPVGGGRITVQSMAGFGRGWSGNAQLLWSGGAVGAVLDLVVDIPVAATYAVELYPTRAPDYGQLNIQVEGQDAPAILDNYAPRVLSPAPRQVGRFHLAAGKRRISFMIVGRNRQSTGYLAGIDRIRLYPTGH